MKKWWKKLERALDRVSRGKKLAVNLALCAFLLVLIWSRFGYPLPAELEFRRLERTHLLPRSEIVFSNGARSEDGLRVSGSDGSVFALDGTELHLRGRWFAGVREDRAVLACLGENFYRTFIREFPLDGGPVLAPLAQSDGYLNHPGGYWVTQGWGETPEGHPAYQYEYHNFSAFLLFGAPEGTVRAELTVRDGGAERTGGGWPLENGLWLLGVDMEGWTPAEQVWDIPYTLRLYDAADTLLTERSGTLWEGENPSFVVG